jgi:hypothetical protein
MLWDVPAWMLYMNAGELAGVIGYTLVFALVESCLLALPIVALGWFLPTSWAERNYYSVLLALLVVAVTTAILLHTYEDLFFAKRRVIMASFVLFTFLAFLAIRISKLNGLVRTLAERARPLAWLYLGLDLISLIVIIGRNL